MNNLVFSILFLAAVIALSECDLLKSLAVNSTGQRYAVLNSFLMKGIRNVRWETIPINNIDSNGKPIPNKISGTKLPDGTTVFGCTDALGKTQQHHAEYQRSNKKFVYRCNNGLEEVLACVGSNRTGHARIEVGKTLDMNGFWHKCQSFPNLSVVYTEEESCNNEGKDYHVGDEITVGFLRFQCKEKGYKVVGCSYIDKNGKSVPINVGDKKEANKVTHYCENDGSTIQYFSKVSGCTKAGKDYKENDTFSSNHLHYKCENGIVQITGCYIDENRPLAVGQDVVEKNKIYRCYRLNSKIEYTEYECGTTGTPSCTPTPIPHTPDDAQSLKASNFGSFAIAQRVGGTDFVQNGGIKFEFNKLFAAHQ